MRVTWRRSVSRWGRGACSAALVGLLLACPMEGRAREIYRQKVAQAAAALGGAGRNDTAQLSLKEPRQGLISFDLERPATSRSDRSGAVPFRFLDADGKVVLLLRISCSFEGDPTRAAVTLTGDEFARNGLGLWSPLILLDEALRPGRSVHFDLTWDDDAGHYGLFVDGRAVDAQPGTYDKAHRAYGPDGRKVINEANARRGEPPTFSSLPVARLLSRARTIVVGERKFAIPHLREGRGPRGVVYDTVVSNLVVAVDEPLTDLHSAKRDVKDLAAAWSEAGVVLTWSPPEVHGIDQGYLVYRRAGAEGGRRFEKLTPEPVHDLRYVDPSARAGETYRYSVTAVYTDGRGGDVESQSPPEVTVTAAALAVTSLAAEKPLYGAGQEIVVTLRGTPDAAAAFSLAGVTRGSVPMEEVDDGVYVGRTAVPAGANATGLPLSGTLTLAGATATASGPPVALDTTAPEAVLPGRVVISAPWAGEIEVSWDKSASADVEKYGVYRATAGPPATGGAPYQEVKGLTLVDTAVTPGLTYYYAVVPVDRAGNRGAARESVSIRAVAGEGPAITSLAIDPLGRPVKPGEIVTVTAAGESGGTLTVDLGTLAQDVPLSETGRTGRYVGAYTVQDADVGPTKGLHRVVAHLTDALGSTTDQAGPELAVVGRDTLNDHTPPALTAASHDGFQVAGFSGKLVAGDILTVTAEGEPAGYASFAIAGVIADAPMTEAAGKPGTYRGTYTVTWDDEGTDVPVVVHLSDEAGNESTLTAGRTLTFDTRVRLLVTAQDTLLPADTKSQTRLVTKATDANGDEISGHRLALTLSTTEEYTGVVGGGRLADREARMDDEDDVEVKWGGVTDGFGEVAATYTAGFAAKTALILAKDLTTGDVGAGWLHTYVASTVALQILPRAAKGAADQAILRLTADPTKLTADGRSTSRLTALLTDLSGNPLGGKKIAFSLGNGNGRLRTLDATTDAQGRAQAEYRAGTLIGTVTITASVQELGVTANVQIVLMADAPAKIDLVASAAKLIAGERASLSVRVTDIHDNPNAQVPVTFQLLQGAGDLATPELLTDRNGEGATTFTAGIRPGLAVIEARHTSRAPTEEALRRIFGTVFVAFAPEFYPTPDRQERDRVKVAEWLVEPGDEVTRGQPLVTLESGKGSWTLGAPADGVFVREVKHRRDRVDLGDTVGYVEIDPEVWTESFAP